MKRHPDSSSAQPNNAARARALHGCELVGEGIRALPSPGKPRQAAFRAGCGEPATLIHVRGRHDGRDVFPAAA